MSASLAKSRGTSPTKSVQVNASHPEASSRSNPNTSTRASFQSPTKSSLARSHPDVLSKSPGRSRPETRGKSLRQELLGHQRSENTNGTSLSTPQTPGTQDAAAKIVDAHAPLTTAPAPPESFSATVARTFADVAREAALSRSPLKLRQPSTQTRSRTPKTDGLQAATKNPRKPITEWTRDDNIISSRAQEHDGEPELPPTPIQLGLSAKPDKPRGLAASSSPRSSRSGSGRRQSRRLRGVETSSPLKPKAKAPDAASRIAQDHDAAEDAEELEPVEAAESEPDAPEIEVTISVPDEILKRQSLRDELATQLSRLQDETSRLETALEAPDSEPTDPDLLVLLTTSNPSCARRDFSTHRSPSPTLRNPTDLGDEPLPYLTLFAPGNLQLETTTTTISVDGSVQQVHTMTISAPPPWPAHIFEAAFKVTADIQDHRVLGVNLDSLRPQIGHKQLREWIQARLTSSLHKLDVGGLIWGVGSWWNACIKRAQIWAILEKEYPHGYEWRSAGVATDEPSRTHLDTHVEIRREDVQALLPHLAQMSMSFSPPTPRGANSTTRRRLDLQILLTWDFELDWTGEVEEKVRIVADSGGKPLKEDLEKLFQGLVKQNGVLRAMEWVWGVVADGVSGMGERQRGVGRTKRKIGEAS